MINQLQKRTKTKAGVRSPLNFKQEQAILCLYRHAVPAHEIAAYFKLTRAAVYYHFRKFREAEVMQDQKQTINDILTEEEFI